jgi:hypothetical protein
MTTFAFAFVFKALRNVLEPVRSCIRGLQGAKVVEFQD